MRKFIVFAAACLVACSFLLMAQPASAAIAQAWEQADENHATFMNFSFYNSSNYQFGVYDLSMDASDSNSLALKPGTGFYTDFFVSEASPWRIYEIDGAGDPVAPGLLLTSKFFGVYLYVEGEYLTDYSIFDQGGGSSYMLTWDAVSTSVILNDANPVPIPTALFLFGSGLVGLAGFRRKTKD